MPMCRLLYTSHALLDGDASQRRELVREIATLAAESNSAAGLTGTLLYIDDCFVQVLEGPAAAVETIFETICCDLRHENVELIDCTPIKERLFGDWSMALLSDSEETTLSLRQGLEEIRFLAGVNANEAVRQMRGLLDLVSA